ncbi:mRNA 3'-end-processing protein Rna14p [Trichomonascus vanleenenianus]|uniref:cleavage polyadenylation factor subunit RNA14 n=1 Tax=Trichomonascus vanleenenianus TaxID=2268995 RepID=UPI003EC9F676
MEDSTENREILEEATQPINASGEGNLSELSNDGMPPGKPADEPNYQTSKADETKPGEDQTEEKSAEQAEPTGPTEPAKPEEAEPADSTGPVEPANTEETGPVDSTRPTDETESAKAEEAEPSEQKPEIENEEEDDDDDYEPSDVTSTNTPAPQAPPADTEGSPSRPIKRKRLPQDVIGRLEDEIAQDPHNVVAWRALTNEIKQKEKLEELREVYERMLKYFPTSAETWMDYAETELENGEFLKVEQIFQRCLPTVLNINLWTSYLGYIRRVNNINTDGDKARNVINEVFEFVLGKIGIDKDSGHLWTQYLDFIRSRETSTPWEQQQKNDLLRKTYRRAIQIPLTSYEVLWQGYSSFETNLNKSTARKFINEKSPAQMKARAALREMERLIDNLDRFNTTPLPRKYTEKELDKSQAWFRWINWEKSNPLETDKETVDVRVSYAYKQAVLAMRYYPEIWFDAAEYAVEQGRESEQMEYLKNGVAANPYSFMLHYKKAELEEKAGNAKAMKETFLQLIDNFKEQRNRLEQAEPVNKARLDANAKDITMVYTVYMKAIKRLEGIKEARKVFGEGRKLTYSMYYIYVASAMMEYYNDKESGIAGKIFEVGLKRHSDDAGFVKQYFDFLIMTNDDTNARALFEKSVVKMSVEAAKPLYDHFLKYEANYGELSALQKLEKRCKEIYGDKISSIDLFANRYRSEGYDPINEVDIGKRYLSKTAKKAKKTKADTRQNGLASAESSTSNIDEDDRPLKRTKEDSEFMPTIERAAHNALPSGIMSLLKQLPPSQAYDSVTFDPVKLVKVIKETMIPDALFDSL